MAEQIKISLTTFVDFVSAVGTSRLTRVRKAKEQYKRGYDPRGDFWRQLRLGIIAMHKQEEAKSYLDNIVEKLNPRSNRRFPYQKCIRTYKKWMGRKRFEWFEPGSMHWTHRNLIVLVNPELGLKINGEPHLIKLYFKAEPLSKYKEDVIHHLMRKTPSEADSELKPGILEVQRGKHITQTVDVAGIDALLVAEASAFLEMWNRIEI